MPSHPAAQGAPNSAPSSQSQSSELGKRPNPEPNNPSAKRNSAQASVPPAQAPPPRSGPTVSAVRHQMDPKRAQEKQRQKQTAVQVLPFSVHDLKLPPLSPVNDAAENPRKPKDARASVVSMC
eukprot:393602-Rhodomonas_salina.5